LKGTDGKLGDYSFISYRKARELSLDISAALMELGVTNKGNNIPFLNHYIGFFVVVESFVA
jgi:hypothetical protein